MPCPRTHIPCPALILDAPLHKLKIIFDFNSKQMQARNVIKLLFEDFTKGKKYFWRNGTKKFSAYWGVGAMGSHSHCWLIHRFSTRIYLCHTNISLETFKRQQSFTVAKGTNEYFSCIRILCGENFNLDKGLKLPTIKTFRYLSCSKYEVKM